MNADVLAGTRLVGIGEAAERCGVSERALRYYQQVGLITPTATSAGTRRYAEVDLARVRRVRELQELLGFQLEEIRAVLADEDRVALLRAEYHELADGDPRRREIVGECLGLVSGLRDRIEQRHAQLAVVRAEMTERVERLQAMLADG